MAGGDYNHRAVPDQPGLRRGAAKNHGRAQSRCMGLAHCAVDVAVAHRDLAPVPDRASDQPGAAQADCPPHHPAQHHPDRCRLPGVDRNGMPAGDTGKIRKGDHPSDH
ncbi:hypothetical protein SDC9_207655 [bioreactor metagenome]|uniref:Uncharacterized protein n=1 Tax=bioreactor metagenome TaxID=1076179 RepID=A0A645J9Z7_9ZZZZ